MKGSLYLRIKVLKMDEFEVFKFGNTEKDLEERHPHKVVTIHKGKVHFSWEYVRRGNEKGA